ncbi:MAG TPA: type IV secretion system DNA-binding domain-containing protein [Syntrophales bacterium]|nr:type IV secretion system DNA-binding domain-containing protein [Syntrophales bacterium]
MLVTNNKNSITPFAVTNYRHLRKRFGIKEKDRLGHMYVIGKTGTGKSTLLKNLIAADIRNGNGLALIDPHGDLAEDVFDLVPEERIEDVIYFNPQDLDYPTAFNLLERATPYSHYLIVSGLISVFKKVWADFWGPRLEHILRNALFTLLERPQSTLLDMPRLLTDKDFRKSVVYRINHQQVRDFWQYEFEKYSAWLKAEATAPILNKIGQFLTSVPLRNIVGQQENSFRIRKAMDEGKILIANLSKGKLGEDNAALLGALLVTRIQLAALSRANIPEKDRRPFYLYVDEFHNFITSSFTDSLSETRKYGLGLVLANQYIFQLDEAIRESIFGNVGTIISFRVGAEDAKRLALEFNKVIEERDLVSLENHHIFLKLMIDGASSEPFSAITLPPPQPRHSFKEQIIANSRAKYCRPRKVVEREILLRRTQPSAPTAQKLPL